MRKRVIVGVIAIVGASLLAYKLDRNRQEKENRRYSALHRHMVGIIPVDVNNDGFTDTIRVFRTADEDPNSSYIEAIDSVSGKSLWEVETVPVRVGSVVSRSSFAVNEDYCVITGLAEAGGSRGLVAVHRVDNGKMVWGSEFPGDWPTKSRVLLRSDKLYVGTRVRRSGGVSLVIKSLDLATGVEQWSSSFLNGIDHFDIQFSGENELLIHGSMGELYGVLDLANGSFSEIDIRTLAIVHDGRIVGQRMRFKSSVDNEEGALLRTYLCNNDAEPTWCSEKAKKKKRLPTFWLAEWDRTTKKMVPKIEPYLRQIEKSAYNTHKYLFYKNNLIGIGDRPMAERRRLVLEDRDYILNTLISVSLDAEANTEDSSPLEWTISGEDFGFVETNSDLFSQQSQLPFQSVEGRYSPMAINSNLGQHIAMIDLDQGQIVWKSRAVQPGLVGILNQCLQEASLFLCYLPSSREDVNQQTIAIIDGTSGTFLSVFDLAFQGVPFTRSDYQFALSPIWTGPKFLHRVTIGGIQTSEDMAFLVDVVQQKLLYASPGITLLDARDKLENLLGPLPTGKTSAQD